MIPFFTSFSFAIPVTYLDSPPSSRITVQGQDRHRMVSQILVHIDTAPTPARHVRSLQRSCSFGRSAASVEVPEVGFGNPIIQKRYQPCDLLVYYRFPCYSRSSYTSVDEYSSTTSLNAMQYWTGQQCLDDLRLHTTAIDFEAVSYSIVIIQLPRFSWSSSIRYAFVSQP